MSKRFNMKFSFPSFQMCRSKNLSSLPVNPVPAIYRLSPVNHKAHDVPLPSTLEKKKKKKKVKLSRGRKSTSSIPSRITSGFLLDQDEEEESETLISCMTSFSDEFYHDQTVKYSPTTIPKTEKELVSIRKMSSVKKVQMLKKTTVVSSSSKASMTSRKSVEGKVKESFAVVKKSKDPYEDFKKSMLEMIMEMEISEAEDLEQLLQCFLALNSRSYHEVIVRAFMEIWQQMFIWNPAEASRKNLQSLGVTIDLED